MTAEGTGIWPRLVSRKAARNAAIQGVVSAGFVVLATAAIATSNVLFGTTVLGISYLAYGDALVFAVIGFGIHKMSRVAAVAGMVLYVYERSYMVATRGGTGNVVMFVVILLGFVNGVRGTFAFRRLPGDAPQVTGSPAAVLGE